MVDLTGMTLAVEKSKNGLAEEHTSASPMQPSPGSLHQDNLVGIQQDQNNGSAESGKPISFYFAFLSLSMGVLLVSLDVTALPVAVAVRPRKWVGVTNCRCLLTSGSLLENYQ